MTEPSWGGSVELQRVLGYHSPVWWTVNICTYILSGTAATAVILRVLYGRFFNRDPEAIVRVSIENLMARLVLMVSLFDLIYDLMWLTWGLLMPPYSDKAERWQDYRRSFFVFTQLLMYVSHITLAAHLYAWVVRRSSPAKLYQRFLGRISVVVVVIFLVAMFVGFGGAAKQTNQSTVCSANSLAACYAYVMLFLAPASLGIVTYFYVASYRTVKNLVHRHLKTAQPHPGLAKVSARIRNRLFKYTLVFCIIWGLDALFMYMYIFRGPKTNPNTRIILQTVWNVNAGLAGFIDALVMGWRDAQPGRLTSQPTHDATSTGSEALKDDNGPPHMQQTRSASVVGPAASVLGLGRPSTLGPDEVAFDHDLAPVKPPPRVARHIFTSTYNMGGSGGLLDPGEMAGWIPLGYDLYAIGLQESERLSEVAAAVQKRIGEGGTAYRVFSTAIGDATILHGQIALLVFGRAADLGSGALRRIGNQQGRVHNGMNLGIVRAANKGMVGLSFRYHDQTVAFVNTHFAADKKGRSGTFKRVKDATKTLRELVLVSEDLEFDCHITCHHVVVLGDMNFRVQETPEFILQVVRESVAWEAEEHSRRQRRRGGGKKGGVGAVGWRDIRHACFRVPKAASRKDEAEGKEDKGCATVEVDERAAAAEWEEGDEEEEEEDGGGQGGDAVEGLSGGVRDSDVKRAQKMSRMLKSARVWNWLTETEELSIQMREGRVFHGFQEQIIRFPPSFKWVPGANAQGFSDPSILESLYKVRKKEGAKTGLRPPSYTDRVLVHSLPDERRRLRLRAYDLFEGVTRSDHRPVALAMDLMVQQDVIGFERVRSDEGKDDQQPPEPFHVQTALCVTEVAISGLKVSLLKQKGPVAEARILFPSLSEDPLRAQRTVLRMHDFIGFDDTRHYGQVFKPSKLAAAPATQQQPPPPPLALRFTRLLSVSAGTGASSDRSLHGGGSRGETLKDGQASGGESTAAPAPAGPMLMDPALLKSLHCFRWSAATDVRGNRQGHQHDRAPVRFATLASLEHSTHALVKLVNKDGKDMGQGVICLRGLIRWAAAAQKRKRPAAPAKAASSSTGVDDDDLLERGGRAREHEEEEDVVESVTVELSRGGEYRGVLECNVSLRIVGQHVPQQLQLIARDSSVLGGGGAASDEASTRAVAGENEL